MTTSVDSDHSTGSTEGAVGVSAIGFAVLRWIVRVVRLYAISVMGMVLFLLAILLLNLVPGAQVSFKATPSEHSNSTLVIYAGLTGFIALFDLATAIWDRRLDGRSRQERARAAVSRALVLARSGHRVAAVRIGIFSGAQVRLRLQRIGFVFWDSATRTGPWYQMVGALAEIADGTPDRVREPNSVRAMSAAADFAVQVAYGKIERVGNIQTALASGQLEVAQNLAGVPESIREALTQELVKHGGITGTKFAKILNAGASVTR